MKIIEPVVANSQKPKRLFIFDRDNLFGRPAMAKSNHKHPLAELLRDEIILRFLGRSINASASELLDICNTFLLSEFKHYPDDILESAIKDLRRFPADEIANTHLILFLKRRVSEQFGTTKDIDDLVFDAAVDKELGQDKDYPPFILKLVAELSESQLKLVRKQIQALT